MNPLDEISFFEQIIETPKNELVEKAIEDGRIPIGYNCYPVPRPLLSVGKAFPVRMRTPNVHNTELADFYMSSVICSYSRSLLEASLNNEFDFLNGVVFATSCQHIIKCGHNMDIKQVNVEKENFFVNMLDAPQKTTEPLINLFASNLKKTAKIISEKTNIEIDEASLTKAIKEHNSFNAHLQEISDMRRAEHPQITGSEFQKILVASQVAPQDMLLDKVRKIKGALKKRNLLNKSKREMIKFFVSY